MSAVKQSDRWVNNKFIGTLLYQIKLQIQLLEILTNMKKEISDTEAVAETYILNRNATLLS